MRQTLIQKKKKKQYNKTVTLALTTTKFKLKKTAQYSLLLFQHKTDKTLVKKKSSK